ncbi:AAA family ATPase [Paracoccus sp. (in: a-proteobacteria)]|uniref:ATP-binding protein n=1 Tax=Paracoccus sp. TaxID=267 RepID=UPI003A8BAD09
MRLERLDLTRYGNFTDKSLTFAPPAPGEPDLHIIYGPNEAGKSTLFSAWLDFLFQIPKRSRHDFLHPGPTMQIGALLSHAGAHHEMKRLKRNAASLLDEHDAPIPETLLQSLHGNLSRDGYCAMFSLDDDTLVKGGESILANHGDLGEMLFSASSGLTGLAPRLESLRGKLDGFHRRGKRSGGLYDARKQLEELDRQRKQIEVSANALKNLTREADASEQAWREARAREDETRHALERCQELAGTFPLLAQLAGLEDRLAPLSQLPDADAGLRDRVEHIEQDRQTLINRIADHAQRLQGLADKRSALTADPAALAHAEQIEAAEAMRAEHETALKDLPRRIAEAQEIRLRLRVLLSELGHPDAKPSEIALPDAALARMRGLLAEHSGVITAARTATAETRKASDLLARERALHGDPGPAGNEEALTKLVKRLRAQDVADNRARALRDRDQAQAALTAAIADLAPWAGDGGALAGLTVPADWQITAWEAELETARRKQHDAQREAESLGADLDRSRAETLGQTRAQSATGVTLAAAAAARSRRETLWAAHRQSLDTSSADAFEQALREDDRVSALVAEAMADARREALQQAGQDRLSERLELARTNLETARHALTATETAIAAACSALELTGATLADLKAWLDRRLAALDHRQALLDAENNLRRCDEALATAAHALAVALDQPDRGDAADYEPLFATATARIDAAERNDDIRQRLKELANAQREREQTEAQAQDALAQWRRDWATASHGSILSAHPDDSPGLGAMLDQLDRLGAESRALDALNDRIDKMESNRKRFQDAKSQVVAALGLPDTTAWTDILPRLRRARDIARDHLMIDDQICDEQQQDSDDSRALSARNDEAARIGAAIGWDGDPDRLPVHVASCIEAATLRQQIAALRASLRERPVPADDDDADATRQKIEALKTDLQLQRDETETRHSACLEARRLVDDVGGDDALARIAQNRANLLQDTRERVQDHLAARIGLIAFEAGLRRYRDQHRSAMLNRASDAFRQLSCGAYASLAAQPDGAQEVLVAHSKGGAAKLAADMSKGTRFQLYLALRIAGFHELAQSRPVVPFIADDIMESFDDDRGAATFALLTAMSRVGQVIYLTHHRHLCDIARATCPQVNVVNLLSA